MNPLERWQHTWALCEVEPPEGLLDHLIAAYQEPHRAYHTLQHLAECFAHLDATPMNPADPVAVELALWFHDAIYDTRSADS